MAKLKLTDIEKQRMRPAIRRAWHAIAEDIGDADLPRSGGRRVTAIVEIACDANRPMLLGGMSKADDARFSECYSMGDTQKWLRAMFRDD